MRRVLVVLVLFLGLTQVADCQVPKPPKFRAIAVSSLRDLKQRCKFPGDLYACTAFESRRLELECFAHDQRWRLRAGTHISPVVYLWDNRWLGHERLHLEDVFTAVETYRQQLEARRYDSEGDCQQAATAEIAGFPRQVDLFAAASNDRRHYLHSQRASRARSDQ